MLSCMQPTIKVNSPLLPENRIFNIDEKVMPVRNSHPAGIPLH